MIKIGHAAIGTNRQTKRSVASLATRKRGGNPEWTQRYVPILPDAWRATMHRGVLFHVAEQ
jgi:hypothetical protein